MNKNYLNSLLVILVLGAKSWSAPVETWTLAECIARAQERSLLLQSARLNEKSSESQWDQARKSRLPDLSASVNQSLYDSPLNDAPQNHYSLSLGLNSSVLLWNAGQLGHNINQKRYQTEAARQSTRQTAQDLAESVINAYMRIWSLAEAETAAQEALLLSKANLAKDSILFINGGLVANELAFSQATVASDSLALLQSRYSLTQARTTLRQLLEIPWDQPWDLAPPDTLFPADVPAFQDLLHTGLEHSAGRQSDSLQILAAEAAVRKAASAKYPSVSLGASASTGLAAWESDAYGSQMKNGYTHRLTLGVQIPIVDWGAAQANVLQAQISKESSLLNARTRTKQLENTLEQLVQQTESARLQWEAAILQFQAQENALRIVNEKRELGMVDNLAFIQQKNQYQSAQARLNQAKYSYLLGQALLGLYTGNTP